MQNRTAHILAFQKTVADSVDLGVMFSNVYIAKVAYVSSKVAPIASTVIPTSISTITTTSGPTGQFALQLIYTVVSYGKNSLDNTQLANALTKAVTTGVFDDLLNLYAQTERASGLIGAKSTDVQVTAPRGGPGESDFNTQSGAPVPEWLRISQRVLVCAGIGLVLGVVGLLLRRRAQQRRLSPVSEEDKDKATATVTMEAEVKGKEVAVWEGDLELAAGSVKVELDE